MSRLLFDLTMPQRSPRQIDRSAVECSAASAAAAMWAAADSLQARLELVLDERLGALTADQRGFLQVARKDGQRLLKLIGDFREIALAEAGLLELDWGRVELGEAAGEAVAAVATRAETLGKTVVVQADQAVAIAADAARVHRALARLAQQAVQQSAPGSPIELRVEAGGIAIAYEAEEPPPDDSLAVAFAAAIARAHGGLLTVSWAEARVEIVIALEPAKTPLVRLGVAA
jgi:signal transduction histidine kinase